jgi:hypothetical protein
VVGFDLADYSVLTEEVTKKATPAIAKRTENWSKTFAASLAKHKLTHAVVDVFCIPFTDVQEFRSAFLKRLG